MAGNDVYCIECWKLFCTMWCKKDYCPECVALKQQEQMKQAQEKHTAWLASVESNREALQQTWVTRQVYWFAPRQDD